MRAGDRLELDVTALSLTGEGLATIEGRTLGVFGAYPGERIEARLEHLSKQHPRGGAKLLQVLVPHPQRVASPCPDDVSNGGRCTGCPLGTLDAEAQREAKRAMLRVDHGLEVESIRGGEPFGYRASAKRIAFRHGPRVGLGSYVRGSHHAASMSHCRVDHPRIAEVARAIERRASELGVPPFDEKTGEGLLRAVWLKTDGEAVLVTLVASADDARIRALAEALVEAEGVALSIARPGVNDLRGREATIVRGVGALRVPLGDELAEVGPLGFLQPNPTIAALAYRDLVATPDGTPRRGALALDLYAGAGSTTRMLRRSFDEVIPVESHPESAAALGVAASSVDAFLEGFARSPDLVVANPPRAGLGEAVCARLARLAPKGIAIMSCHPASLARDLAQLEAAGYRRVGLRAYDTLPQTPHVELVAYLER